MFFRRFIAFSLFITLLTNTGLSQIVEKGLVHFPQVGWMNHKVMKLTDSWQFYYGKHLSALEMQQLRPEEKFYLSSPSNWMNLKRHGEKTPAIGIATYYMKIVIDTSAVPFPRNYGFRIGDITSAYTMYINGQQIMSTGVATPTKDGFKPGYYPHVGLLQTNADTLNVIIHVSNFFYPHFSGISRPILFGQEKEISRLQLHTTVLSIFLMCIFGILFFFHLMVFFANLKDQSHLMVSLLAFIILVKMLLDNEMTIFHFFPDFNFFVGYRFWMLTLMTIPILFKLIKLSFPNEMHRLAIQIVYVSYGLLGVSIFILPLSFLLENLMTIIYFTIICVIYLLYVITRALINKRKYAVAHFISFCATFTCLIYDLITVADPNKVNFISQIGLSLYLMTQTSIILLRFIQSHKLSVKLTKELEAANLSLEATVEKRTMELQQTNAKLEQINTQKNFMLATTTHDLKNSFNILINCSAVMSDDKTLTYEQRLYSGMIQEATRNGYRVLENILSWARMQMTDYSKANDVVRNLKSLVMKEIDSFKNQLNDKSLDVNIKIDDSLLFTCDEEQLYSIGRNLLSNAIKFSQPGGEITVSNHLIGSMVEIRVHDDGVGMDAHMIETLFNNTIDNKRRGTSGETGSGLGLIIVKELVENNNGTISCTSEPERGTDFILQFPFFMD